MTISRKISDSDGDKRRALRLAANAVKRADVAEHSKAVALRFAADTGSSLREIAEATGLAHTTVKGILDRVRAS